MTNKKIDIVGGGLAGLSSAISIKKLKGNFDVNVYEKYKEIGYNPDGRRCGEGHTVEKEWAKWKPEGKSIFNEIKVVETILGDKKYYAKQEPGLFFVLNRQEFISQFGREAKKLGVNIQNSSKIKTADELDGDYIIDASGCHSILKKNLGIDKGIRGVSYQQTIEDSNYFISDKIKVYITDAIGYYWIFPRNPDKNEINLGVGVLDFSKKANLKQMLEDFKDKQKIEGRVNYVTGGLVPIGIQKPLIYNNILFVGDAGIGTYPVLGKGIYRALYSGEIAAQCIVKDQIKNYPRIISRGCKWDSIGKTYIKIDKVLSRIGEKAVLSFYRLYLDVWYSLH